MKIYVASFFNTRDRILPYVAQLREMRHVITSSWLSEAPRGDITKTETKLYTPAELQGFAVADVLELHNSDVIILDTVDVTPRGGREVEWGAFVFGKVRFGYIVGPKRNVFHELATGYFDCWENCVNFFRGLRI